MSKYKEAWEAVSFILMKEHKYTMLIDELIERATPKKCINYDNSDLEQGKWCPTCGLHNLQQNDYCYNCGQALDWSE